MNEQMIEAVARAICDNMTLSEDMWEQFFGAAQAAIAAAEHLIRAQVIQEIRDAAGREDVVDAYNALVAECRLKQALEPTTAFLVMFNRIVGKQP